MMRKMPCQERCQAVFMQHLPAGVCRSIARRGVERRLRLCLPECSWKLWSGLERRLAGGRSECAATLASFARIPFPGVLRHAASPKRPWSIFDEPRTWNLAASDVVGRSRAGKEVNLLSSLRREQPIRYPDARKPSDTSAHTRWNRRRVRRSLESGGEWRPRATDDRRQATVD
jgi:hypothetical protein